MLKPPHPVAVAGYLAAHASSTRTTTPWTPSQATSPMEVEVVRMLAAMFGLPNGALGHLTSSGTIANLEALWIARSCDRTAASSTPNAPTTRTGACARSSASLAAVPALPDGRIDLDAVEAQAGAGTGTIVLTARHHRAGRDRRRTRGVGPA